MIDSDIEGWRDIDQLADNLLLQGRLCADAYDRASTTTLRWYDHRFDWLAGRERWSRWERAVYGTRYLRPGNVDKVLDLCCGDGFFTWCVGTRAKVIHGIDRDKTACTRACKHYANENTFFFANDILDAEIEKYDAVLWWDAIEHFDLADIHKILGKIAVSLRDSDNGRLVGSTPRATGQVTNLEHKHEFNSEIDLRLLLGQYFDYVETWESQWTERRTQMYFMCQGAKK